MISKMIINKYKNYYHRLKKMDNKYRLKKIRKYRINNFFIEEEQEIRCIKNEV